MRNKNLYVCHENIEKKLKTEKSVAFFRSNSWHENAGITKVKNRNEK